MIKSVLLGYEVPTGSPVEIPIGHLVVTGQTQQSGKTTTLEALIARAGLPAIAFLTKRGEGAMRGRPTLPFFRERADWQYVQSILESTMREKLKFERAWIVRACQGAHTLADVRRNVARLEDTARRGMSADIYMLLGQYLDRVIPLIASLPKRTTAHDFPGEAAGLSVMDLTSYPEELQMLVIASTLEWIHKNANGVITVIPEAWKFIPEAKNTPVKVVAEKLAREGAALKNFLWIDSQDIAGVAKMLLRSCSVWLVGVQREANEIRRALANMPEGMKRPKSGAVATLEIGHFFVCHGRELRHVYVQPAWMDPKHARDVARGQMDPYELARVKPAQLPAWEVEDDAMYKEQAERLSGQVATLAGQVETLTEQVEALQKENATLRRQLSASNGSAPAAVSTTSQHTIAGAPTSAAIMLSGTAPEIPPAEVLKWADQIRADVVAIIRKDPVLIRLAVEKPAIEITIAKKVLPMDDSTIRGKVAKLIHAGFFQQPREFSQVKAELVRRGVDPKTPNLRIADPLHEFTALGFFFRDGDSYILAHDADVRVVNA